MRVDLNGFEAAYCEVDDPWEFATSSYEIQKYNTTLAYLNPRLYETCFEPACSVGVLTARLANRADHVLACDTSPAAIEIGRAHV